MPLLTPPTISPWLDPGATCSDTLVVQMRLSEGNSLLNLRSRTLPCRHWDLRRNPCMDHIAPIRTDILVSYRYSGWQLSANIISVSCTDMWALEGMVFISVNTLPLWGQRRLVLMFVVPLHTEHWRSINCLIHVKSHNCIVHFLYNGNKNSVVFSWCIDLDAGVLRLKKWILTCFVNITNALLMIKFILCECLLILILHNFS